MLVTIYYLSGFNNYYNRQLKLPEKNLIEDFREWIVQTTRPTAFNPNDGVNATIDVNYSEIGDDIDLDYLLTSEDNNTIKQRWFVLERRRNLSGQWHLVLQRDLLAEYYYSVFTSPIFLEKGKASIGNPLIFNKENGINYNQIKRREELLKDETGCGWIVGYVTAKNLESNTISIPASGIEYPVPPISHDDIVQKMNSAKLGSVKLRFRGIPIKAQQSDLYDLWIMNIGLTDQTGGSSRATSTFTTLDKTYEYPMRFDGMTYDKDSAAKDIGIRAYQNRASINDGATKLFKANNTYNILSDTDMDTIDDMNGGTFYSDGLVYKVEVFKTNRSYSKYNVSSSDGDIYYAIKNMLESSPAVLNTGADAFGGYDTQWIVDVEYTKVDINITYYEYPQSSVVIDESARILKDAPYRMFAIPVGSPETILGDKRITVNPDLAKRFACEIATQLGEKKLYDLQYLPYFPMRSSINSIEGRGVVNITGNEGEAYSLMKHTVEGVEIIDQYMIWCDFSNFNATIRHEIKVPDTDIEFKVANETEFVRICSPNYSGTFEFKPTMNMGVTSFEINCTYKPYQPYIHINPLFNGLNGLYGGDYNDQRGLVCTGDFSLPTVLDSWVQYQINNKSYYDSFQRQIENMNTTYDINRKYQEKSGIIGAITAGVSGASAGAMAGSVGGPIGLTAGAAVGSIVGGVGSAIGLSEDLKYQKAIHEESLSFAQDNFGYQLQNVKALPYTLGKVSAFTINHKVFPFIEYYGCTEAEKEALRQKIKYNGMTIMAAMEGCSEYMGGFIQGQLIRYAPRSQKDVIDYHATVAIAAELHKGVYT